MKTRHPLHAFILVAGWLPLAWLIWAYFTRNLTVNPIQAATQRTGDFAIVFLLLSLACTPLYTLTRNAVLPRLRRPLGLFAFFYAALHFLIFAGLDYQFDQQALLQIFQEKQFVILGNFALTILTLLAVTSFRWWMKRLGKSWKTLHRFVYLAGILVVAHYALAVKGDALRLQGNTLLPVLAGILLAILFILRLPPVKGWLQALRSNQSASSQSEAAQVHSGVKDSRA
ncbi:MAG TPA: protein-methionine-sulfoxide reductase heme-binding subunit MsrQ [Anaerolineaceae bacterium]